MTWELESELVSSSDVMKTLIGSYFGGHEMDPLMMDEEEVHSPLKWSEESSNLITVITKEFSNFLGVEDVKPGLGSAQLLKLQE